MRPILIRAIPIIAAGVFGVVIVALPVIAKAIQPAGELPPWQQDAARDAFGYPIEAEALDALRGGADIVDNDILVNGNVQDNTADHIATGSNTVDAGSFANASGISTVIQNTGANVLIQNAMIVNVQFAPPTTP